MSGIGMLWLWLTLFSVVAFSTLDLLMRLLAVRAVNPRAFAFVYNSWGALFSLGFFIVEAVINPVNVSVSPTSATLLFLVILLYGLYERLHFAVRKYVEVSTLATMFRLSSAIAFFGSLIFLREAVTIPKLVGACLVIGASVWVVQNNSQGWRLTRPAVLAFFCAIVLGLAWMVDKPASSGLPASLYSVLTWGLVLPVIAYPRLALRDIIREMDIAKGNVVVTSFLNAAGYVFMIKAYALAEASRVIPIISASVTLSVLGGVFILGERKHLTRKIIASIVAFAGIVLLG